MKVFIKEGIIKKLLTVMITIIMICNFILPNYAYAANGGDLFTPITELLVGIADRVLATMQALFVGDINWGDALSAEEIKTQGLMKEDIYTIKYSPAVIFSGKVPAFDINFIKPMGRVNIEKSNYEYEFLGMCGVKDLEKYGFKGELIKDGGSTWSKILFGKHVDTYYAFWQYEGIQYYYVNAIMDFADYDEFTLALNMDSLLGYFIKNQILENVQEDIGFLFKYIKKGETTVIQKDSTAGILQENISQWYVALRTFALVGLLSVLVYIGIRIILSSGSSQNQAKYKSMLKDWVVALCILFLLHYIMAFTLNITGQIGDLFETEVIEIGDIDSLMSNVRTKIGGEDSYWTYFGYVVMYIALVILTITFTIEYLKRVVFVAFLTMIAPLIALTYPIDKVKDGQAQAFSMWIKEYVYNCLIQPVHLLLYTIFIGTAGGLAENNPIYAIVALAFFKPALNFFKKMFGFEKASSINTLGAAAGGALVMNALNKLKAKGPKEGSGGNTTSSSGGVRTTGSSSGGSSSGGSSSGGSSSGGSSSGGKTSSGTGVSGGLGNVGKKYIYGADVLKGHGKRFVRAVGGAAVGAMAATTALAANVADGELIDNPTKAATEIGATTLVGYHAGNNIVGRGMQGATNLYKTYNSGAKGYQQYYDNGLTDDKSIQMAINNGIDATEYKEYSDLGITSVNDIVALNKNGISVDKLKEIQTKTGETDSKKLMRYNIISQKAKADGVPKMRGKFITWARGQGIDVDDAKELYNKVSHFW